MSEPERNADASVESCAPEGVRPGEELAKDTEAVERVRRAVWAAGQSSPHGHVRLTEVEALAALRAVGEGDR